MCQTVQLTNINYENETSNFILTIYMDAHQFPLFPENIVLQPNGEKCYPSDLRSCKHIERVIFCYRQELT